MEFVEEVGNVDYELFGVSIGRNEENGFLSVTDLKLVYDRFRVKYNLPDKNLGELLTLERSCLFLYGFLKNELDLKDSYLEFRAKVNNSAIKILKSFELWRTTGRGLNKKVECCETIFKFLYCCCFCDSGLSKSEPDWIRLIIKPYYKKSFQKTNSKENHFIEESIDKMRLFLTEEPTKQYIIGKYRYDLMFRLFDKRIIVEYNEGQHANSTKEDFLKSEMAYKNGFYVVYIPHFKESDFKEYMLDIASNGIDANGLFSLAKARFSVYDKNNQVLKEYSSLINKKILNTESIRVRAMCSLSDLKNLVSLESKLLKIINKNPSMNFKEISAIIKDFKI